MRLLPGALLLCSLLAPAVFSQDLPDGEGKELVVKACTGCHGAENFTAKRNSNEDWKAVVDTMIGYGAEIKGDQSEIVITYLTKYFGKDAKFSGAKR